ncbi:unnamed protein product [Acanthoscelides obtectus]|uniref:Uncharacterized protein n=1 Tax=Acanthoscelides obtectus TaxID=200917 RepID=A0A9P0P4S8_ACAOB|nr:unnamed protein product [Acanthoscelides obtectus]CAK1673473.1 hypothetical protein AOBTE_LOCUS29351 [Acanthoscelides obtectus]
MDNKCQDLIIYYQNTGGLRSKTTGFFNNVRASGYDIICLTETWLKDGVCSSELFGADYTVFIHVHKKVMVVVC